MRNRSLGPRLRVLTLAVLVVSAAACGPFRRGVGPEPAVLVFTNESLDQADVYVVAQGLGARRLGTVMAGRTERLTVPSEVVGRGGNLNVVARLLARSIRPQTGPVPIEPGEEYEVRLPVDQRLLVFLPARQ